MSNDAEFFEKLGTALRPSNNSVDDDDYPAQPSSASDENNRELMKEKAKLWAVNGDIYWEGNETTDKMKAGLYEVTTVNGIGYVLKKKPINTDELIVPPDETIPKVIDEFKLFWNRKDAFLSRGYIHKRGFMIWGPAGGGKTSLLSLLMKILINEHQGLIIDVDHPAMAAVGLRMVRKIEPERPLIILMEDLDSLIEQYGENHFLSLLDGEDQVANVVAIATTNYPERLDPRIINRPSRFDKVITIGMPNEATRRLYLQTKEPGLVGEELEKWVKISDNMSLAHLKEMIVAVKCLDQNLEEVAERLSKMKQKLTSTSDRKVGFNN